MTELTFWRLVSSETLVFFWFPLAIALISLAINVVQLIGRRRVTNKIAIWAKDAKSMSSSLAGIQDNIKKKKLKSIDGINSNVETLGNFANSMFLSLEEELGRNTREIKPLFKKPKPNSSSSSESKSDSSGSKKSKKSKSKSKK